MILQIKFGGRYMVTRVPVDIHKSAIICVILCDLFLSDFESVFILKVSVSKFEHLLCTLAS
jgi:hypothetical protein